MHTDQYLQWDSHHNLAAMYSVISTLNSQVRTVCTMPELLNNELQHIRKTLTKCKYPKWAPHKVERNYIKRGQDKSNVHNTQGDTSE